MKTRSLLIGCALFAALTAGAQERSGPSAQQLEAAARLAQYEVPRVLSDEMVEQMSRTLPPDRRAAAVAFLKSDETKSQLARMLTPIIARHFTLQEIDTQYRLSSSEIGQSIQRKQAAYYGDILSNLERDLGPILDKFLRSQSK